MRIFLSMGMVIIQPKMMVSNLMKTKTKFPCLLPGLLRDIIRRDLLRILVLTTIKKHVIEYCEKKRKVW